MNIFQRQKRVYVQYDLDRRVRTLRLDMNGDGYESDDLEKAGFEHNQVLTDGEIAGLVREIENNGFEVILQKQ